jgi:hypothetical protein
MRKCLQITFVLLYSSLALAQGHAPSDMQMLELREVKSNNAHLAGDAAALDRLWADDTQVIVPNMPPMTKSRSLAFAKSGRMQFQRYETSGIKVRLYGDAAVVTGRLRRTRTISGKQIEDDWRFAKTYTRESGNWRVVLFQASEADHP